jgi:hypothetical protein
MTSSETYKDYHIFYNPNWNSEVNGFSFSVTVYDKKSKSEKDFLFTEKSQITNFAIQVKYGSITDLPQKEIIEKTIAKVKARIDLGLFEMGNEYFQCITTENLEMGYAPIDDQSIQDYLLKGLLNIRKLNPSNFFVLTFSPLGFCEILKISLREYVFNAGLLMEEGYIDSKVENGIEEGQIYITKHGVRLIMGKTEKEELKKTSSLTSLSKTTEEKYDVAISFAGEEREFAERLAQKLIQRQVKVFYDSFEAANLWGKNLYDHFSSIYSERSKYCVMLLSKNYEKKAWTNLERRSAQARAFRENREYILPIKIDDTNITGLQETVGYIDSKTHSIDQIVDLIINKLSKTN